MEPKQCYKRNCTDKVEFCCDCSPSKAFMCREHILEHVSIKGYSHNIQTIFLKIDQKIKISTLTMLYEEISKINQIKKDSINAFNQLFLVLENLLRNITQILDTNLHENQINIEKVIAAKNISNFETDELLASLLSQDVACIEKMCLFDASVIKNIVALNVYVTEINEKIKGLNIYKPNDIVKNNIDDLISQLREENLVDQKNQLTCELEKWEKTSMSWNQDINNYPKTRESFYLKLGIIEYFTGNVDKALSIFNFTIKLNPNYSDCYFYKGLALISLNRNEESLECWNHLLQENSKLSFINIIKEKVFCNLRRNADIEGGGHDMYSSEVFSTLASICIFKSIPVYGDNLYAWDEIIRLNPKFSWAYIGKSTNDMHTSNERLSFFYKAIENDEYCYEGYNFIAFALYENNKHEESLDNLEISISINPYNPLAFFVKASIFWNQGRREEAEECLKKLYWLSPNSYYFCDFIGRFYSEDENYEEAIKYFDKSIWIKPGFKKYQDNKEEVLRKLKENKR